MRIGGSDGMRLTRAAFAVIVKFSEQLPTFKTVWDEVEMIGMGIEPDVKGATRMNEIVTKLREAEHAEAFEALCTSWEQAA